MYQRTADGLSSVEPRNTRSLASGVFVTQMDATCASGVVWCGVVRCGVVWCGAV